ncbi:MAG: macro domain-containing protein [Allosphingosinicella sp.]
MVGDWLAKLKFPSLLLALGVIVSLLAISSRADLKKGVFESGPAVWPALVLGFTLCLLGVLTFLAQEGLMPSVGLGRTRKVGNAFTACIGSSRVALHVGRLEDVVPASSGAERQMVMLPTNEFFDDDCVHATNTACGAYVGAKIKEPRYLEKLKAQIADARKGLKSLGQVEKRGGEFETTYGTGVCLFIEDPAGLPHSLLLAAVAFKRADTGFQSDPASVFQCLEKMAKRATDERVNTVYLPLLGAGKGSLSAEASLMTTLLAISTLQRRLGGFDAKINIVIFQPDKKAFPAIAPRTARKLLGLAADLHSRVPALN